MNSRIYALLVAFLSLGGCDTEESVHELIGTWVGSCRPSTVNTSITSDPDNPGVYFLDTIIFDGNTTDILHSSYSDADCMTPNNPDTEGYITITLSYDIGSIITTTDTFTASRLSISNGDTQIYDLIYRISGQDLLLGDYITDMTSSLDTRVVYTKQ